MTNYLTSNKFFLPIVFFCGLLLVSITFTSCGDDEETNVECNSFPSLGGSINLNGESLPLTVAQRLVSTGTVSRDSYTFQIGGVSADCNSQQSVNLALEVPAESSLTGTYNIRSFLEAGPDEVTGSFLTQSINPISQSLVDFDSGRLVIVDNGDASYEIEVEGSLVGGGDVTLSVEHQF